MSKAPPKAAEAASAAAAKPAKPKKKRRLLWLTILVLLLGGGGAGAWVAMSPATEANGKPAPEPSVFVNLATFTVNLQPGNGDKYLQVAMTVKVHGEDAASAMKQQMPDIRNRLLLLLSSKRAADLLTVAGKQHLASEVLAQVRQPLPQADRTKIAAVFFTSFVIQ